MAASSITSNFTSWARPQFPGPFSSYPYASSSSLVDLGFLSKTISLKNKPIRKATANVECTLNSTSVFDFPKQPCQEPLIAKEDNPPAATETPQPQHQWSLLQRAAAMAIDTVENALVSWELQHPLPKSIDPRVQIAGNFASVPEQPVRHSLPVTGTIPDCISGVYLRNGANPLFEPVAGHHFFDGDGMVHAVTIDGGAASYACRFIETERLVQERKLGRPVFPKAIGELRGHIGIVRLVLFFARGLFGLIDHRRGTGLANTGLVFFNGRLLALSEEDLPYELRITPSGDVKTIGRYSFGDQLKSSMTAHPKMDPESGELFALSYVLSRPSLKYFRFSPDGKKSPDVEITLSVPTMTHDFAITQNFVVVPDQQVVFKIQEMIRGGSPVIHDKSKKSRFGILPKYAHNASGIVWVESPDTFCFHLWNAWEEPETSEVVVIGSCIDPPDSIFNECDESFNSVLSEIRLNLRTRESTRRPVISEEHVNLEVGTVNRNRLGRKTRYAYLAIAEPWPRVSGFAKVDLVTGEVRRHEYGDGRYGGEPFFLAREKDVEEDDGYVLALVHDERTWKSELQIVNAVDLQVEATVELPSRVPYGFHGTFVNAEDLAKQT